jgi:hypothetical protein
MYSENGVCINSDCEHSTAQLHVHAYVRNSRLDSTRPFVTAGAWCRRVCLTTGRHLVPDFY